MWYRDKQKKEFLTGNIHANAPSSWNNNLESQQKKWIHNLLTTCWRMQTFGGKNFFMKKLQSASLEKPIVDCHFHVVQFVWLGSRSQVVRYWSFGCLRLGWVFQTLQILANAIQSTGRSQRNLIYSQITGLMHQRQNLVTVSAKIVKKKTLF